MIDIYDLTKKLIQCKSVTPIDDGVIDLIISVLEPMGFNCHKLVFEDVTNLYAFKGSGKHNLCFAGHTDVVPVGGKWQFDPFAGEIHDEKLYGRGAVDMKAAIACFIAAVDKFIKNSPNQDYQISFLISGNEEGDARNGTPKILDWLQKHNHHLNDCILGEPTSIEKLGDRIHIGRRGSINIEIIVRGIQGHVAYHHLVDNPITRLINILTQLKSVKLDQGNDDFIASNLEIVNLEVNNNAFNIVPHEAKAKINIRYNNEHNHQTLKNFVYNCCAQYADDFDIIVHESSDSFISRNSALLPILQDAIKKVMKIKTEISTSGGTSDARYISKYCPTIECGMLDKMAHKVDEHVALKDIQHLFDIYYQVISGYFNA